MEWGTIDALMRAGILGPAKLISHIEFPEPEHEWKTDTLEMAKKPPKKPKPKPGC